MDQSLNCEQVAVRVERHRGQVETPQNLSDKSGAPAEIIVPSTASWSEGISPCKQLSWVGY